MYQDWLLALPGAFAPGIPLTTLYFCPVSPVTQVNKYPESKTAYLRNRHNTVHHG